MRGVGEDIERLDVLLSALVREEASLQLRVGQALEVLSGGGVFELGFSSLSAYVLERCDRSVRWAEGARCVARRVEALPELRRALAAGRVSWSMAELLARVAEPEDEGSWLDAAESRTVRQMRVLVAEAMALRAASVDAGLVDDRSRALVSAEHREDEGQGGFGSGACVGSDSEVCGSEVCGSNGRLGGASAGERLGSNTGSRAAETFDTGAGTDTGTGTDAPNGGGSRRFGNTRSAGSFNGVGENAGGGSTGEHLDHEGAGERAERYHWEGSAVSDGDGEGSSGAVCNLNLTVNREDAWLFEATRLLLEQLGVHGPDEVSEALLAEGQGTLLNMLPEGTVDLARLEGVDMAQQRCASELARWRVEAEALSENRFCGLLWARRHQRFSLDDDEELARSGDSAGGQEAGRARAAEPKSAVAAAAARGMASLKKLDWAGLDGHVRDVSRALARHELEVSRLALRIHRAGGWRRLGYGSEAQYARERLGWSLSVLRGRRALALRLERLPRVAAALGAGELGVEAALQVVRVATSKTQGAWVERAQRRTVKHLREEVVAALVAVRFCGEVDCMPPTDAELEAFHGLEQAVVNGRVFQGAATATAANDTGASREAGAAAMRLGEPTSEERRVWYVMLGSLARWLEGRLPLSAAGPLGAKGMTSVARGPHAAAQRRVASAGRVTLRLKVSRSHGAWWRGLEAVALRWLPNEMSWLRFLCLSMWQAWGHLAGADVAYSEIYVRDRYRCTSPVCNRRDVTPHHIRFRSAGGSDDPSNTSTVCSWCHLEGIHGGRIRATGTADMVRWELGVGAPCLVVHGRERLVA